MSQDQIWGQMHVFVDEPAAEDRVAAGLRTAMAEAEASGLITAWFFVRKNGWWRIRYRPGTGRSLDAATAAVTACLRHLHAQGHVREWVRVIYEPEIHAFGGPDGMWVSHELFHRDSRAVLAYRLVLRNGKPDRRRELTLLLCSTMLRAAGLEWYEQGDVWGRVRESRPSSATRPVPQRLEATAQFLTADTSADSPLVTGDLAHAAEWLSAFRTAGAELSSLAQRGHLTRGLREVLSYHVLFHWNRLALPYADQQALADAAYTAILGHADASSTMSHFQPDGAGQRRGEVGSRVR